MGEMTETSPDKTPVLGVDWVKATAGALAAVSTTVLLSTLGAAGTLLGAALGSLAATVATAVYSTGLDRSRSRVRELSALRTGSTPVTRRPAQRDDAVEQRSDLGDSGRVGWRDRLRRVGWRRLSVAALAMFLVVIAAVTAFELLAGRTLASTVRGEDGGGTTISRVTRTGDGGSQSPTPPTGGATPSGTTGAGTSTPTPSSSPTGEPSDAPSSPASTSSPSAEPTPQAPQPTSGTTTMVPEAPDALADQ